MTTEMAQTAKLYEEYSPMVQPSSSIYPLWKKLRTSLDFSDRPEEIEFLQLLKRYNQLILEFPNLTPIEQEKKFVKKELQRAGYRFAGDKFFDHIKPGDLIEVYTVDNMQLYRNLEYFKYSSYTINELISRPWHELFERDEEIIKLLHQQVEKILSKAPHEVHHFESPIHFLQEKYGRQFAFEINIKIGCPVLDKDGNKMAFAISQTARRLSNDTSITFN